jgi:hypothetical protein
MVWMVAPNIMPTSDSAAESGLCLPARRRRGGHSLAGGEGSRLCSHGHWQRPRVERDARRDTVVTRCSS